LFVCVVMVSLKEAFVDGCLTLEHTATHCNTL